MADISGGIASVELLRKQLEDTQVEGLRLETRCNTVTKTVTNMENLLSDIHATIRRLDDELLNVNKWNNFYDGNLHDAYRNLNMLKEDRDKKRKLYELESERVRKQISDQKREFELRKEAHDRNIELVWKKIPTYAIKLEKQQMISSLTEQVNNMGIQNDRSETELAEKLRISNDQKKELNAILLQKKIERENVSKKIMNQKAINSRQENVLLQLRNEQDLLKRKELTLQTNDTELTQPHQIKTPVKASDVQGNDDESGIMTMTESATESPEKLANVSEHEQSLEITMFEEAPSKPELMKTPSKRVYETVPGPVHSTPHHFNSKLSEFLRPQNAKHCSAPPNLTPINSSMLANSSKMITPMNTVQKLDTRRSPMKSAFTTPSNEEMTPAKSDLMLSLPKTPVSPSKRLPPAATFTNEYAMDKGLLAPTPEKENVLHVTPTNELTAPMPPSAPIKNSPSVNQTLYPNAQPDPKKLKPSNSFTKVQRPSSPPSSMGKLPDTTPSSHELKQNEFKPNERGDDVFAMPATTDASAINKNNAFGSFTNENDNQPIAASTNTESNNASKSNSPFGFNMDGNSPMGFLTSGSAFGGESGFGTGAGFGDGSPFTGNSDFGAGSGFDAGSGFGGSGAGSGFGDSGAGSGFGGSTFGGSAGFGASGDNSNFNSGFGGFNF